MKQCPWRKQVKVPQYPGSERETEEKIKFRKLYRHCQMESIQWWQLPLRQPRLDMVISSSLFVVQSVLWERRIAHLTGQCIRIVRESAYKARFFVGQIVKDRSRRTFRRAGLDRAQQRASKPRTFTSSFCGGLIGIGDNFENFSLFSQIDNVVGWNLKASYRLGVVFQLVALIEKALTNCRDGKFLICL